MSFKSRLRALYIQGVTAFFKFGTKVFGRRGLHKVWPFGMIYDWTSGTLHAHEWPEVIDVDGHRIYSPPAERPVIAMWKGRADELEFRLFYKEIPEGGVVVDVGANIGYYTTVFARAVGGRGKVFAFEPEIENLRHLHKNIEANHYRNVEVIPCAVGSAKGSVKLFISKLNPGGHQIYDLAGRLRAKRAAGEKLSEAEMQALREHETEMAASSEVDVVSLDAYFNGFARPIDLIKIDVEGAEGGVVAGMTEIMKKNKNLKLFFEFWPAGMKIFGTDPEAFLGMLKDAGFEFFDLANFKRYKNEPEKINAKELLARYAGTNRSTNVFAVRKRLF